MPNYLSEALGLRGLLLTFKYLQQDYQKRVN